MAEIHIPSKETLEARGASEGGKETLAHAARISTGGAPIFLIAELVQIPAGGTSIKQLTGRQQSCSHPANRNPAYIPRSRTAPFACVLLRQVCRGRRANGQAVPSGNAGT